MNFYVTLTTNCNLRCKYCYGKSCEDFGSDFHDLTIDYSVPSSMTYSIDALRQFIKKDKNTVIIFYGGEPLLRANKIRKSSTRFPLQDSLFRRMGLCSIDWIQST